MGTVVIIPWNVCKMLVSTMMGISTTKQKKLSKITLSLYTNQQRQRINEL